ncbi:MAG: putative sulfate exporter family transporter, partial [Bdellovibrionia bacterium]
SLLLGNPFAGWTKAWTHRLLQISIVGLGAGMNLGVIGKVGMEGLGYTALGILVTFIAGSALGKILKNEKNTSALITAGTAICGGSAIAAVASTIRAKPHETSVALAVVFLLNASALLIFPGIGYHFQLSEAQFGLWSALAIHDTSSVVGAAVQYGPHAAEIATTVKLARALWIIPVSLMIGFVWNRKTGNETPVKAKRPWFILGFLLAAALVTWVPTIQPLGEAVSIFSKKLLTFTLFLIGTGLTRATLSKVGFRPFIQGICLWFIMASSTLFAITEGWIHP